MSDYELRGFLDAFDDWVIAEQPGEELRTSVLSWVMSRSETPYSGVVREPDFDNLWYGAVPGTTRSGLVVVCTYWILESERALKCDSFASLHHPL